MATTLSLISSMATRQLLADLADAYRAVAPEVSVQLESVGGVDAARRVEGGEPFDVVVLAANSIDKLLAGGHLLPGSRVDLVRSGVAVAVRAGAPKPDISSEAAVRQAVVSARSISYSTGPSGVHLQQLFERWGVAEQVRPRIVQAPPGVPVGSLVATGEVELGFQQLSELMNLPGLSLLGPLPPAIQILTVFAGAVGAQSPHAPAAQALLREWASPDADAIKKRNGMERA
jgi:molybdate transport system substrate-binding protein